MFKKIKYWSYLACLVFIVSACEGGYLTEFPRTAPSKENFYKSEKELKMALFGCYKSLTFEVNAEPRPWSIILEVTTDIGWNRSNTAMQHIGNGSHTAQNEAIMEYWKGFYKGIGRCNMLLANIDDLKGQVASDKLSQIKAEARFLRALNYSYLVELFGGVPLIKKPLPIDKAEVARSSEEKVVNFILNEFTEVAKTLPVNYPNDKYSGRATKGAALSFKARTALYHEKWDIAADAAKKVMDLGVYELHDDFTELFNYEGQTSNEIIFSIQYKKGVVTHSTANFFGSRLAGGVSNEVPTPNLVNSYLCIDGLPIDESPLYDPDHPYRNRDPRLGYTVVVPGSRYFNYEFETHPDSLKVWNYNTSPPTLVANADATSPYATFTGYLWRKYTDIEDMSDDYHSAINIILARYAGVLLIYAEAKIEAGQIDASVYEAINKVRQRPSVNMPPVKLGKSQQELRSIVRRERKYELAGEGLRLFDIRRWKIADEVMSGPLRGKIPTGFLSNAPQIDPNGTPDYSNVSNKEKMRVIEIRNFDPKRDYLWPIPRIDILTNDKLEQNPGY